jgi:hypothetical protein
MKQLLKLSADDAGQLSAVICTLATHSTSAV